MSVLIATSPSAIPKTFKGIRREKKATGFPDVLSKQPPALATQEEQLSWGAVGRSTQLLVRRPFLFRSCSDPCHSQPFLQVLLRMPPRSYVESSAQSEAVPCAFRGARLPKPFSPSISSVSGSCEGIHLSLVFFCFSGDFTPETDSVCY